MVRTLSIKLTDSIFYLSYKIKNKRRILPIQTINKFTGWDQSPKSIIITHLKNFKYPKWDTKLVQKNWNFLF